jgi:hypothetical protein
MDAAKNMITMCLRSRTGVWWARSW